MFTITTNNNIINQSSEDILDLNLLTTLDQLKDSKLNDELQLQYEQLVVSYRHIRFYITKYQQEWLELCEHRKFKSTNNPPSINDNADTERKQNNTNDASDNDVSDHIMFHSKLIYHILSLEQQAIYQKDKLEALSSHRLVFILIHSGWYNLFEVLHRDQETFKYIVKTLDWFVAKIHNYYFGNMVRQMIQ